MTRILWIGGLSIALFMFTGMAILCAIALISRNHYSLKAWTMLVLSFYAARFMFVCLRSAIRFGDPTAYMKNPESASRKVDSF
jgi:hypothetical protein